MKILKSLLGKFIFLLVKLFILWIFLSNLWILSNYQQEIIEMLQNKEYMLIFWILLLEAFIVLLVVIVLYESPIIRLEKNIKNFLLSRLKEEDLQWQSAINPHLNYILNFFSNIIKMLRNIKDEFVSGKVIKWEVELAKEIQWKLLNKNLEKIPSLEVIAKSKPAAEIGWDSYDIIKQWDNYYIYVWDATGHWVAAGFVMMMVNALISAISKVYISGAQILSFTNEILKPRIKSNILMTLLLVRWDESKKRLFMSGAGHEYLIVYKYKQNKCFKVKSGGIALGMVKNASKVLKEQEIQFEENDIIVLYTDGITEAKVDTWSGDPIMFWEDRLVKSVENASTIKYKGEDIKTARTVFNSITLELSKFMWYKNTQLDDITLVVANYRWGKIIENDAPHPDELWEEFITEWEWNN